jgi:hypothetical protein
VTETPDARCQIQLSGTNLVAEALRSGSDHVADVLFITVLAYWEPGSTGRGTRFNGGQNVIDNLIDIGQLYTSPTKRCSMKRKSHTCGTADSWHYATTRRRRMWGESERSRAHRDNGPRRQSAYGIRKQDLRCMRLNLILRTAFTSLRLADKTAGSECDPHNFRIADRPDTIHIPFAVMIYLVEYDPPAQRTG